VWYSLKWREHLVCFTSKVILAMTAGMFILGTAVLFVVEPSVRDLPFGSRLMACAFQVMSASSTAGFNTIPIGVLSRGALLMIALAMLVGASPSGTGGGIKTTTVSALLANLLSVLRGRDQVLWLNREVPQLRVLAAMATATLYLGLLACGVFVLCLTERQDFLAIVFEAASALGTVGLSMGITSNLSVIGKITIIALMFAGRCGPLTLGLAFLRPGPARPQAWRDDLAV